MTETTYDEVDGWPTSGGDRVIVVRRDTWTLGPGDVAIECVASFHWTVVAANGEKVGTSGETFTRKHHAVDAALRHHPRVDVAE